jgi:pSer/pThr/pTyr-binding forkhead associated (FHA) protein
MSLEGYVMKLLIQLLNNTGKWDTVREEFLRLPYYRVGRSIHCEISLRGLELNTVSSIHFRLFEMATSLRNSPPSYGIKDGSDEKPSTNGTYLNGSRLEHNKPKIRLLHNDVITVTPTLRIVYCDNTPKTIISDNMNDTLAHNHKVSQLVLL